MGIRGLIPYLARHAPAALTPVSLNRVPARVVVDGNIYMMRAHCSHQTPFPLLNFYAFLRTLVDCGLAPFFVFDSIGANTRHALKDAELVRRRVDRDRRRDLLQRSDAAHRELRAIQQALLSTAAAVAAADGAADGAVDKAVVDARHQMIRRIREYNKTAESLKGRKLPRPTPSGAAKPGGTPAEGVSADLVSVDAVLATANAAEEALETPSLDVAKLYNADGTLSNAALVRLADTIEREAKALAQRERASRALTPKYQADIRMLLDLMDIPYYTIDQIAMEAEALCAVLANSHQADRVMTEDTDALLLSEVPVITKVNHAKAPVLEINLDRGLPALGLTRPQFRDACIMAGNDFTTGMRGVGLHKATGFMRRYASLENVLADAALMRRHPPDALFDVAAVRKALASPTDFQMPRPLTAALARYADADVQRLLYRRDPLSNPDLRQFIHDAAQPDATPPRRGE